MIGWIIHRKWWQLTVDCFQFFECFWHILIDDSLTAWFFHTLILWMNFWTWKIICQTSSSLTIKSKRFKFFIVHELFDRELLTKSDYFWWWMILKNSMIKIISDFSALICGRSFIMSINQKLFRKRLSIFFRWHSFHEQNGKDERSPKRVKQFSSKKSLQYLNMTDWLQKTKTYECFIVLSQTMTT